MKISISWNSTKNHREGNPPLNPPGRCAPPLGQRKTKTISRNTRCFFPWLPVFLIQRDQPTGNPWGASTGWADSVRMRQSSSFVEEFRPEQTFFLGNYLKWHIIYVPKLHALFNNVNVISHYKRYYWTQEQATQQALLCFLMNTRRTYTWW